MLLTATIPMGILQASSTQNDYVLAFWMVMLVTLPTPKGGGFCRTLALAFIMRC